MTGLQHTSADRQRAHSAGQRRIVHYCDCGRAIRGNVGWWSHRQANPDHRQVTYSAFLQSGRDQ